MKRLAISIMLLVFSLSVSMFFIGCRRDGGESAGGGNIGGESTGGGSGHTHSFTVQKTEQAYIASAATCTQVARYYYSCTCGERSSDTFTYGSALGHGFGDWMVVTPATSETDGLQKRTCSRCSEKEEQIIPKITHTHAFVDSVVPPTCTIAGYTLHSCACGEEYKDHFTDALDHSFSDYVSDNATCTADGTKTATCDRCGETDTISDEYSRIGHSFDKQVVSEEYFASDATCVTPATYYYCCSVCGQKSYYTFEYGDALGHTEVTDKAVAGTRTDDGLTQGSHCSVCNAVLVKQEVIHAIGSLGLIFIGNAVTGIGTCTDEEVLIPAYSPAGEMVTKIADNAFENCAATSIIIPDTVAEIGTRAFYGCTGITEINIPSSVTQIGTQIFYKASNLTTVYYDSLYSDENNPFLNIGNIKKIVFGGRKVPSVIAGCTNITEVVISDSVTSIGDSAFEDCSGLTSVTIGNSVTSIGDNAFYYCSGLTSVTIGNSVTSIDYQAFYNCSGLTSVIIPDSVTSIGDSAFEDCSGLTSIKIPDSVTSIGNYAFENCSGLSSVTIPDSVTSIGNSAFSGCSGLTGVTIPDSVTSIDWCAFSGCYKLVEVINNSSLNITKGSSDYGYIAYYALNVKKGGSSEIVDKDGLLFYTYNDVNYLFGYSGTEKELTLPQNYNGQNYEIYKYSFYYCRGLTSVTIPDSVTSIGDGAFANCSRLTNITIPDSVTSIGNWAFAYCSGLESIEFKGTIAQWKAISKGGNWKNDIPSSCVVKCTDGTISI